MGAGQSAMTATTPSTMTSTETPGQLLLKIANDDTPVNTQQDVWNKWREVFRAGAQYLDESHKKAKPIGKGAIFGAVFTILLLIGIVTATSITAQRVWGSGTHSRNTENNELPLLSQNE